MFQKDTHFGGAASLRDAISGSSELAVSARRGFQHLAVALVFLAIALNAVWLAAFAYGGWQLLSRMFGISF